MNLNATFLLQAFSFALLIGLTMKFIWPPLLAAIEERQKRIAEGLASAERSQRDLAQAQAKVNEVNKEARATANESSEERRVGKGCVRTCRSRWPPDN